MNTSSEYIWVLFMETLISGACSLAVVLAVSYVGGRMVFAPLYKRTLLFEASSRFHIADMILLAAHLQIAVGVVLAVTPPSAPIAEKTGIVVVTWIAILFWWVWGIRLLANSGVQYTWHRWLFLGILMPVGYGSSLLVTASILILPAALQMPLYPDQLGAVISMIAWALVFGFGPSFLLYLCNRTCNWLATRARKEQAERDGISFMSQNDA